MVSINKAIKEQLDELIEWGESILTHIDTIDDEESYSSFVFGYEGWYTRALAVVNQLIPDRLDEFIRLYKIENRNIIDRSNYTISDYIQQVRIGSGKGEFPVREKFLQQYAILSSTRSRIDTILSDIKGVLRADIFDNELDNAKALLEGSQLRAAGTIAGVILEEHLAAVCDNHQIKIVKKNPSLADFNEALKKEGVFDIPTWRWIQRLGDIRNYCCHKKEREPTMEEVQELIDGVAKAIKTLF